jgi:hypothetical protein
VLAQVLMKSFKKNVSRFVPNPIGGAMSDDKYQPCPCGSGKKLKFCCFEKQKSLDHASNLELLKRASEFPVYECLVNSDWQKEGLAQIAVVRKMPNLKYLAAVYLVDLYCLGVKNTFADTRLKYEDVRVLLSRLPMDMADTAYEDARSIILGGIEFAAKFGFKAHEDWSTSRFMIENDRDFERKFSFGKDGNPFYI